MNKQIANLIPLWNQQCEAFSKQFQGLILAVSGGADSTALFHIFCEELKAKNFFSVEAFHVNYGLRGAESDRDESFVRELVKAHGLSLHHVNAQQAHGAAPQSGIQEWARDIRRSYFYDFASKGYLVVTGHHLDDHAETILMRMARGSSAEHLVGMKEVDLPFWRPFMGIKKEALLAYLGGKKLPHCHDSSNDKINYKRNLLRHEVVPVLESIYPDASERMRDLALEANQLAEYCRELMRQQLTAQNFKPQRAWLKSLPEAVQFLAVEEMLKHSGFQSMLNRSKLRQISTLLQKPGQYTSNLTLAKNLLFKVDEQVAFIENTAAKQKAPRLAQHMRNIRSKRVAAVLAAGQELSCWSVAKEHASVGIKNNNQHSTIIVKSLEGN